MGTDIRHQMVALLPRLRAFARALAREREAADDLVQGTCERALRAIDRWEPGTRLDSWMFRIMRNLWIDEYRKGRGTALLDDSEAINNVAGDDGNRTAENSLMLERTRRAIRELPEEQRSVLVLVCVEELSYREAADVLELPVGTVMSRLARAREALARMLGEPREKSTGGPTLRVGDRR